MTTGATLDACTKALREAGAAEVLAVTVARAMLSPQKVSRKVRWYRGSRDERNAEKRVCTPRRFAASDAAGAGLSSNDSPADSRFHNPAGPRRASLMQEPVLVLNATYEPINVTAVRRAMVLLLKGVAQAEEMHNAEVHSAAHAHKVPSVIRLLAYRHIPQQSRALSRKNILCGIAILASSAGAFSPVRNWTLDHVVPRSRGGRSSWEIWWRAVTAAITAKAIALRKKRDLNWLAVHVHSRCIRRWQLMRMIGHRDERWRKYLFY